MVVGPGGFEGSGAGSNLGHDIIMFLDRTQFLDWHGAGRVGLGAQGVSGAHEAESDQVEELHLECLVVRDIRRFRLRELRVWTVGLDWIGSDCCE